MNLISKTKICKTKISSFRLVLVFFVSMLLSINVSAQLKNISDNENEPTPRTANIRVIARADTDSVILRWAPTTAGGWVIANQIGYVIEKIILDSLKPIQNSDYVRLTEESIKPLSLVEWESVTDHENIFSAVAAQALYGKSFNPTPMDGGNMSTLKNAADELTNRYSFSLFAADNDAATANALGLRYVDRDIEKDKKYAYRVYLAEKTNQYNFDTAYIVVDAIPFQKDQPPAGLKYESGDGSIRLLWEEKASSNYSGYYVFRSDDDGKTYQQLNKMPLITITQKQGFRDAQPGFMDTSTINYKKYKYQVKGITPFGERSDPAEITAFSKDLHAPPTPKIKKPVQISANEIKISWELQNAPDDLEGFVVSRSDNSLDGYKLITQLPLSVHMNEYIDDLSSAYEAYYTVAAVDTAGNMAFSLPVLATRIDTAPPAVPTGLSGKISEKGVVRLSWKAGSEGNIAGYRILRANDPKHKFIQITGQIHPDTVFVDSISIYTLTRHIYYRIAAVNDRYQHSILSPILSIKRPDVIPPGEAVFADVFVTDTNVILKWNPATSEDLATQILLRRIQDEKEWKAIDTLLPSANTYTDFDVKMKTIYEYTIVEIDSSGLSSDQAFPVTARPYDTGKRNSVENLTAEYNDENKTVHLQWTYSLPEKERIWYVIYKAGNDGQYKEYKSVDGTTYTFIDKNVKSGINKYGVVVMTSYGGESKMLTSAVMVEDSE